VQRLGALVRAIERIVEQQLERTSEAEESQGPKFE
jgi:hypothetical protein